MDFSKIPTEVTRIAQEAGAAIMKIYGESADVEVITKADDSPLTIADQASNEVINEGLKAIFPNIPIVSEENKAIPYETRKDYDFFWMVDPLDGTKEFIKRNGEFTVNIALIHRNKPVAGVVYVPATETLFYAVVGQGAWKVVAGEKSQLLASEFAESDTGLRLVCSRSHLNEMTETYVGRFMDPELVSKGSSLKFMILAEAAADIYPRLAPTMEWDTAAAQAILEEAGGEVLQYETGTAVEYNKEDLLNPFFIAYGNRH